MNPSAPAASRSPEEDAPGNVLALVTSDPNQGGWGEALGRYVYGYSQPRRRRIKDATSQVSAIVTYRIRDTRLVEFLRREQLGMELKELHRVLEAKVKGKATEGDVRAAFVSLAATCVVLAEDADCPVELRETPDWQVPQLEIAAA